MQRLLILCLFGLLFTIQVTTVVEAQSKPQQGNILVAQNAGISEVSATDFKVVQTIPWPSVAENTEEQYWVGPIAYDGQKIIYVLVYDKDDSNARLMRWDVTTASWLDALELPDPKQSYEQMALVGDSIIASPDRGGNVQIVLATGKVYRMNRGRFGIDPSDGGKFVYIYNSFFDRKRPLSKVDLSDGSIVQTFPAFPSDFIMGSDGFLYSMSSREIIKGKLSSGEKAEKGTRHKSPWKRKRGMDVSGEKETYRLVEEDMISELNDDLMIISHSEDRRLFTINKNMEKNSGKTYEFETNTGAIFVVR